MSSSQSLLCLLVLCLSVCVHGWGVQKGESRDCRSLESLLQENQESLQKCLDVLEQVKQKSLEKRLSALEKENKELRMMNEAFAKQLSLAEQEHEGLSHVQTGLVEELHDYQRQLGVLQQRPTETIEQPQRHVFLFRLLRFCLYTLLFHVVPLTAVGYFLRSAKESFKQMEVSKPRYRRRSAISTT